MDLSTLTLADARRALDAKEYSALDLTNAYLAEIERKDTDIHAYIEVWAESARAEARAADERIARGESAPLTGIPIAIKDNMLIEGRVASSASKILENYVATYDAAVIEKLKAQGAVFLADVPTWTSLPWEVQPKPRRSERQKTRATFRECRADLPVALPLLLQGTLHSSPLDQTLAAQFANQHR
jgi:hypothetical protein